MLDLADFRETYLKFCKYQKKLDYKTLKAYNIDLKQFIAIFQQGDAELSRASLTDFITELHKKYKPKSAKRKIASVKAFLGFLEYEEVLPQNPFAKMRVKFKSLLKKWQFKKFQKSHPN